MYSATTKLGRTTTAGGWPEERVVVDNEEENFTPERTEREVILYFTVCLARVWRTAEF